MKLRSLLAATFILLALAGALYWSGRRKPTNEAAARAADAPPVILKFDQAAITELELKNQSAPPIVLEKSNSGAWQITEPNSFRADQGSVSSALDSLSPLNSLRLVEDKASDLKPYGLDQPAFEADITEKGNKTQKLLVGDQTPTGNAVYAKLSADPRIYTIASYTKSILDKSLNDLRDKRLLTMDAGKISRIELDRKNQEIEFGRTGQSGINDDWQILKPRPLRADGMQVDELLRKLTAARMDLSGPDAQKDAATAFAHATPVATAKVTDQSGSQDIQIRKSKETYYAKSSVVDGAYKVDADLGQAVDKGLDDFRNKKLLDFGFSDPDKVEMHSGPKAYYLTKGGADWWSDGRKMDMGSVQAFLFKLRSLAASKFVESGFARPAIELTVTSDDGKRVEKVSIAKSGDGYIGKRENDTTLYWIDSGTVDGMLKAGDDLKPASSKATVGSPT